MDNVNGVVSESNNSIAVMPPSSTWASTAVNLMDLEIFDLDEALAVVGESSGQLFPTWESFVAELPAAEEVTEEDVCSVCMEGLERRKSREGNKRVPCGHVYHSNCIALWLEHCNSCPLCRRHFSLHF